jgi:K+ transporter
MSRWRKLLFVTLARNSASPIDHFGLSADRTVSVGSNIGI